MFLTLYIDTQKIFDVSKSKQISFLNESNLIVLFKTG